MVRIHLCQILYIPAYFSSNSDLLDEPAPLMDTTCTIGQLRHIERIENLLIESRAVYVKHITDKICELARWSQHRGAKIVAFPEYSIPYECLPYLQQIAREAGVFIVAGTHRIRLTETSGNIYQSIGLDTSNMENGSAVAPVIYPYTGEVRFSAKAYRSKWEPDLEVSSPTSQIHEVNFDNETLHIAVIPCIDALHFDRLSFSRGGNSNKPNIIICPYLSPTVDLFSDVGKLLAASEIFFAFVNSAEFGGTGFNVPQGWELYLGGRKFDNCLDKGSESILEIDVNAKSFFLKKGSVSTEPPCGASVHFPIEYRSSSYWADKYIELEKDILELLVAGDSDGAIEWIDNFLSEQDIPIPEEIVSNLHDLRHRQLVLYSGDVSAVKDALRIVWVSQEVDDSRLLFAKRLQELIVMISGILQVSTAEDTQALIDYFRVLKAGQSRFGFPEARQLSADKLRAQPTEVTLGEFVYRPPESTVASFQDRGAKLDDLRDIITRGSEKVIVITGMPGIGKTELVKTLFVKVLTDWKLIWVNIASGSSLARVAAEIGKVLGFTMDIDALSTATSKVFASKMAKLFDKFFDVERHAIIIDDARHLRRSARDYNQLQKLMEIAGEPKPFKGSRLFIISSIAARPIWAKKAGIARIHLGDLEDIYIRRVLEYQLRSSQLVLGEETPEIPQRLLDIVGGHPLAARVAAEASRSIGIESLAEDKSLAGLTTSLVDTLLPGVELSPEEEKVVGIMSILRLPVRKSDVTLLVDEKTLIKLASRGIVDFDGYAYFMHQILRKHFSTKWVGEESSKAHEIAAEFYRGLDQRNVLGGKRDINVVAELAHHLSFTDGIRELRGLRVILFEELYPAACSLYAQGEYDRALDVFRLLSECRPNDPAIWAYIGRCYGRRGQWKDSDDAFEKAIDVASALKQPTAWLYRGWAHIRARFGFYPLARVHLDDAKALGGEKDPSYMSADAYVKWKTGDPDTAEKEFEETLRHYPNHGYTLKTYSMLLDEIGETERAKELRERLRELEAEMIAPLPYDIEFESDGEE